MVTRLLDDKCSNYHPDKVEIVLVPQKNDDNEIVFDEYAITEVITLRRPLRESDVFPNVSQDDRDFIKFDPVRWTYFVNYHILLMENKDCHCIFIDSETIHEKNGIKFFCGNRYDELIQGHKMQPVFNNKFIFNLNEIDINNIKITSKYPYK